jgi:broad specificity phosphatase PhoE
MEALMNLVRKPFVYMRHGETAYNERHLICGSTNIPLTLKGEQQALQVQKKLRYGWSRVVCSDLLRARQTAALAVPHIAAVADAMLNERNFGDLEGMPIDHQLPSVETPPAGESWSAFSERIVHVVNRELLAYEFPLIIAHGGVYRVLYNQMFGTPDCHPLNNVSPMLIQPLGDNGWVVTELGRVQSEQLRQWGLHRWLE